MSFIEGQGTSLEQHLMALQLLRDMDGQSNISLMRLRKILITQQYVTIMGWE